MDVEPGERGEIDACLGELARVNRLLGGRRTTLAHLGDLLDAAGGRVTVLDVAAGGGDMADAMREWAGRRHRELRVTLLDRHPLVLAAALRGSGSSSGMDRVRARLSPPDPEDAASLSGGRGDAAISGVRGDALTLPFRDRSFDLCVTSLFFHHLEPGECERALLEMRRVARVGVLVNDLVRDRLAWAWILLLSRLFSRNRLVRHDGPLSVRRAYRPEDFRRFAARAGLSSWGVRRHFAYRMCLWGRV